MAKGIYKQKGSIYYWIRYADGNGRIIRESTRSTKHKDAEVLLSERKKAIREGREIEPMKRIPNHLFNELAGEYLKWCERQRSFKSKKGFVLQLSEVFGNVPLKQFSTKVVEQFQSERLQKGNKPSTVNRLIATLKHMLHKGYQWEMLSEETWKRVTQVKLLEENNKRLRYLSKEECQTLLSHCKGTLKSIVIFALNTGCRKEEILGLTWSQVDLRHGFILLGKTKNGEKKEIPINEDVRAVLQEVNRRIDVPYVFFCQSTGKRYRDVKRSFNTALRRAGIRDFHFHDLRHTFASHLIMAGIDITTVSMLLGHKSLTMTLRYSHLAPDHLRKAVNMLNLTRDSKRTAYLLHS